MAIIVINDHVALHHTLLVRGVSQLNDQVLRQERVPG